MPNPWQSFSKIKIREKAKPILYHLGIDPNSDELIDNDFD